MTVAFGALDLLAAAGISDCAEANVCPDDQSTLGLFLLAIPVLIVVGPIYLLLALFSTIDIVNRPTGIRRGLGWAVFVWAAPVAGALIWWSFGPKAHRISAPTNSAPSEN